MPNLFQNLALLETRGLVRVIPEGEKPVVRFKHALTREATYNSMLQARRAELHRAAAQTLADLHTQPDLEMVLTIAEHWQRGNEDGNVLATILPHAQNLIYTGRSISLTALLARVNRENLGATQQRDLEIALADAHAARGEYEPAQVLYTRALPYADSIELRARLLQSLGIAAYHLGNFADAIQQYRASLELAETQKDIGLQARATGGLGLAYFSLGETAKAIEYLSHSRALGIEHGESLELAIAEYNLAVVLRSVGEYAQAIVHVEHALQLEQKFGHDAAVARSLQVLGACYHSMGDLEIAGNYYDRAIAKSQMLGDFEATALVQINLAELVAEQGNLEKAIELYSTALLYGRSAKQESLLAYNLAGLSNAQLLFARTRGDPRLLDPARQSALEALQIAQTINYLEIEGIADRVLAEISAEKQEFAQAEQYVGQSINLLTQVGSSLELERAQRVQQEIARQAAGETHAPVVVFPARAAKG